MTEPLHERLRRTAGLPPIEWDGDDDAGTDEHNRRIDPPGPPVTVELRDDERYAIYVVTRLVGGRQNPGEYRRLAETSREGIGITLTTLREEEQITNDSRIGILDRQEHVWIINPWGKGDSA